jgi:hypothetical protein
MKISQNCIKMKFETWLDDNYPYRNRNYRNERLYGKSKYDETYLYNELLEIFKKEIMIPLHYPQQYDVIDFVSDNSLNFNEGNVIKYITRARKKGTHLIDLEKALDYIQREIKIVREKELKQIENEQL